MQTILDRSKDYEVLYKKHDPEYGEFMKAMKITTEFIIKRKLIVYGGTAIDDALRLKGDKIYSDAALAIPDLDVYSSNNIEDAYDLADILYAAGWKNSRAVYGFHIQTMKVDIGDKHFVTDITYKPPEVFDNLPCLEYDRLKIIHPDFQRIDVHISLSFPFSDPPAEVIFNRWEKDIKRFNKLNALYPIDVDMLTMKDSNIIAVRSTQANSGVVTSTHVNTSTHSDVSVANATSVQMSIKHSNLVFSGFLAYAVFYSEYAKIVPKPDPKIVVATFELSDKIVFSSPLPLFEVVHYDIMKASKLFSGALHLYEPFINMVPQRLEIIGSRQVSDKNLSFGGKDSSTSDENSIDHKDSSISNDDPSDSKDSTGENSTSKNSTSRDSNIGAANISDGAVIIIYSTKNQLVSINSIKIAEHNIRTVGIQYLLRHFISMYMIEAKFRKNQLLGEMYLRYYCSLMRMIGHIEEQKVATNDTNAGAMSTESTIIGSAAIFFPSINVYGNENINLARELALERLSANIHGTEMPKFPGIYNAAKFIAEGLPHPSFDIAGNKHFSELGREIPIVS